MLTAEQWNKEHGGKISTGSKYHFSHTVLLSNGIFGHARIDSSIMIELWI